MKSKKAYAAIVFVSAVISMLTVTCVRFIYENIIDAAGFPEQVDALLSITVFLIVSYLLKQHFCADTHSCRSQRDVEQPDLSGRWVGFLTSSYQRDGQNVIVPITLEITQNMARVSVRAYFEKGYSESVMTNIETIDDRIWLTYIYDNSIPGKSSGMANRDKGAVILEYFNKDKRILKGSYFNDLKPQSNYGEIRVTYSGSQLIGRIK